MPTKIHFADTTDLDAVKRTVKAFLNLPLKPSNMFPFVVYHPIFSSSYALVDKEIVNLMDDPDKLAKLQRDYEGLIDDAQTVFQATRFIRDSYGLTFLKFSQNYLSREDFAQLLANAWVCSENTMTDTNVSPALLRRWFKALTPELLMHDEEFEEYAKLPDHVHVYHGSEDDAKPKDFSWTTSFATAKWFSNRFAANGSIWESDVNKQDIWAYFTRRGESEVLVDFLKVQNVTRISPR